ncbi:hypothetical protein C7212DRAFT_348575 [Tuber magnatum]|uniref:Uncharacterized protein n=1 Tax=Tuber magnatum TaxID=42249 RepID=A0A317SBB5_9PEZI|nr:hypothetical protein C7212DRAFT_348575 [Tuber magnatum]
MQNHHVSEEDQPQVKDGAIAVIWLTEWCRPILPDEMIADPWLVDSGRRPLDVVEASTAVLGPVIAYFKLTECRRNFMSIVAAADLRLAECRRGLSSLVNLLFLILPLLLTHSTPNNLLNTERYQLTFLVASTCPCKAQRPSPKRPAQLQTMSPSRTRIFRT